MSTTVVQWHDKLVKFVPSWWFENNGVEYARIVTEDGDTFIDEDGNIFVTEGQGDHADALFYAIASIFQQIQLDTENAQTSTFILDSDAPVLDLHGDERTLPRNTGESDASYQTRIQNCLFLNVGVAQISASVNAVLNNGEGFFFENFNYGFYDDPDITETNGFLYFDDYYSIWISEAKWYNWWTLIIPEQVANQAQVFLDVVSVIEANKALGTTYDIVVE